MEKKEKSKVRKIVNTVIYFVLVSLLLTYIGMEIVFPDSTAKIMQVKVTNVISDSMEPNINTLDAIVITNFKGSNLKVGDVITFKKKLPGIAEAQYVTHRIVEINTSSSGELSFKTKGDKPIIVDNWDVSEAEIIGRYLFRIPKGGYIILFFQSWVGFAIIGFNLVIIGTIVYIIKSDKKEKKKKE